MHLWNPPPCRLCDLGQPVGTLLSLWAYYHSGSLSLLCPAHRRGAELYVLHGANHKETEDRRQPES